eukprot:TRINITY_DN3796_c0_g2_i1.p1 TRINITY_DN3796_c0_g2~~TRINITY_DN3796_c0_g2_i1.p1  ORF type:complete len:200 (-),score=49.01 TRINITY_DN3796_c0_g2_i1:43-642(-)
MSEFTGMKPEEKEIQEVGRLFTRQYFGEGALVTSNPRRATATAAGCVKLLSITRHDFKELFGDDLKTVINKNFSKRVAADKKDTIAGSIELDELREIHLLGKGSYGTVSLVQHKITGKTFALKTLNKQKIKLLKQAKHVLNEKQVLETINHTFIANLVKVFDAPDAVQFVTEAALGGELYYHLQEQTKLPEKEVGIVLM